MRISSSILTSSDKKTVILPPPRLKRKRLLITSKIFNWERIDLLGTNLAERSQKIRGHSGANGLSSRHHPLARSPSSKPGHRWAKTRLGLVTRKTKAIRGIKAFRTDIILRIRRESGQKHIFPSNFRKLMPPIGRFLKTKSPDSVKFRLVRLSLSKLRSRMQSHWISWSFKAIWKSQKTATSSVKMFLNWARSPSFSRPDLTHLSSKACTWDPSSLLFSSVRLRSFERGMNSPI